MTCREDMSQVMNDLSSKFEGKAFLLFPKCESYHWSLYSIFNVYGEDKYDERSILYLDSDNKEPNQYFIKKLSGWLVSKSIEGNDQRTNEINTEQPKGHPNSESRQDVPLKIIKCKF